jgi:2'-5' RNA ligase
MRLFVAVDLDPERHEAIARVVAGLRRAAGSAGWDRSARWVSPRNLHLTIRFIGEVDEAAGARGREALGPPIELPPFDVVFEGAGVFPPRGAPRVLWIGVERGAEDLAHLFDALESRLRLAGIAPEARPFSPHLTIARFRDRERGRRGTRSAGAWSADLPRRRPADALAAVRVGAGPMPVRSVTLYQSRLTPAGPEYSTLLSTPLGGKSRG